MYFIGASFSVTHALSHPSIWVAIASSPSGTWVTLNVQLPQAPCQLTSIRRPAIREPYVVALLIIHLYLRGIWQLGKSLTLKRQCKPHGLGIIL